MVQTLQSLGIDRLSVSERLELIAAIWDTIPDTAERGDIPDWHREELERRIAAADSNPEAAISWQEVKARLRNPSSVG